jgi:hypothetical protein
MNDRIIEFHLITFFINIEKFLSSVKRNQAHLYHLPICFQCAGKIPSPYGLPFALRSGQGGATIPALTTIDRFAQFAVGYVSALLENKDLTLWALLC